MATKPTETRLDPIPMAQFLEMGSEMHSFEIIDGALIEMAANPIMHQIVGQNLYDTLRLFLREYPIGRVFFAATFVLEARPNWVAGSRIPDVMFYRVERLNEYLATTADWGEKPLIIVPDLVAEVISINDRASDVARKTALYFRDGVQVEWKIDPAARMVTVARAGSNVETILREDDLLADEQLLPGFSVRVGDLFRVD